jgi:hypothetical protein
MAYTNDHLKSTPHENASAKFNEKDHLGFRYTNRYTNRKQSGSDRLASNYSLTGTGAGVSHHGTLTTIVDRISNIKGKGWGKRIHPNIVSHSTTTTETTINPPSSIRSPTLTYT